MGRLGKAIKNPGKAARKLLEIAGGVIPQSQGSVTSDAGKFWAGAETNKNTQALSHWQGEGMWDEETWGRVGRSHFRMYEQLKLLIGRQEPVESMAEWGPGGGVNAAVFSREIKNFYGVDISQANLEECGRQLEKRKYAGWHPVPIDVSRPEQVLQKVPRLDFFLCTAVFQHFPSKDYGLRVAKVALDLLANDGFAIIQTRYDDGSERLKSKSRDYMKNALTFTSYRVDEFWNTMTAIGFEPLAVVLDPAVAYAFYFLRKGQRNG